MGASTAAVGGQVASHPRTVRRGPVEVAGEARGQTRERSACDGEVYTSGGGLIWLVEDEMGCRGGRDRIAVSDEATLFTAVDSVRERLLDAAATEAMMGRAVVRVGERSSLPTRPAFEAVATASRSIASEECPRRKGVQRAAPPAAP